MKKFLFSIVTLLFLTSFTTILPQSEDYDAGYRTGWKEGYESLAGERFVIPTVEMEYVYCSNKTRYKCGYDKGYANGIKRAKRDGYGEKDKSLL